MTDMDGDLHLHKCHLDFYKDGIMMSELTKQIRKGMKI